MRVGFESGLSRALSPRVRWSELDWPVLVIALLLLAVGMTFVHAVAESAANAVSQSVSFAGHRNKVAITLPMILVGLFLRPAWLRRNAGWIYAGCLALLVAVYFVGLERNNARRWIPLPKFDLQPSELAKVGLILVLARTLASNRLLSPGDWLRPLLLALVPMLLVAGQPDLGTAMTLAPVTLGMLYLAGARARAVAGLLALGLLIGWGAREAGWVREYQLERIDTWVESYTPERLIEAREGAGFHAYHARVSAGNGGVFGRGLGRGVANETGLLPERESDSLFVVIAEEGGFVGASAVILLYALLVALLMLGASGLRDRFARLVVGGVALYFAAHLVINVSVNLGLLPMTGLTLPLISTGGSSLLASFLALGLALGLAAHQELGLDQDAFRSY